jgi:Glycosyl transferase family 2
VTPNVHTRHVIVTSVVVPAHNEASVIARLLNGLLSDAGTDEFQVVVVANGCTDGTAAVARSAGPAVTVVETPVAGKFRALRLGDVTAAAFPRLYVDADVELSAASARALADAVLSEPGIHAAAPERVMELSGCNVFVRWYYAIWQRLPTVREGLYGRGVIAVDGEGHGRLLKLPEVMGDDFAASLSFSGEEARIVTAATVVVRAPRTIADLIRRRVRVATGVAELHRHLPTAVDAQRTSWSDLIRIVRERPTLAPKVAVFLGVTAVARWRARAAIRSGDFGTWLRDESSRRDATA